jgi:hypothetical protein
MESINRSRPRELARQPALAQEPAQPEPADAASVAFSPPLPRSEPPPGLLPDVVPRRGVPAAGWPPLPLRVSQPDRDRAPGS